MDAATREGLLSGGQSMSAIGASRRYGFFATYVIEAISADPGKSAEDRIDGADPMIERIGMTERWSDAVIVGDLVFLAGHVAEKTRGQSVKVQTEEVLLSLDETLAQAGVSKNNLVSVTIYLADMAGFAAMNEAWDAWVAKDHAPARATVEARLAYPDLLVEMTAIASR